jgi:three-Cys-motif partner protein
MPNVPQPENDGLIAPVVGPQSGEKHYFLKRYIDIFTKSMKSKWSLHFVDLFAGAGIEQSKGSETLHWGSPMLAAQARYPFDGLHFCELDKDKCDALRTRVNRYRPDAQILNGDANEQVENIAKVIPPRRALSLAFFDPYGLQLDFRTLETVANLKADLIIFFPDRLDILRNWRQYYYDNPDSKLDRYLGADSNWRAVLDSTPASRRTEALKALYRDRLKERLHYSIVEHERIPTGGRPLYYLVFCSRSDLGEKFWREISRKKPDGQRTWDF